ncbi:hypothetical protein [Haloarcula marina]|uniref:hypothetical protein n=1 Tax=Haloarcula marina TaxID=2961574 RepID=UPI0020B75FE7|nr:hypothetical protein [Halomicroarcula marina]
MATTQAQYDIRADRGTNTLYIELAGTLDGPTIKTAAAETITSAKHLSEGFSVITDISKFRPPSPEAAKPIKRAQAELKEMGVGDVVRIVDEETSTVTENAFQRRSRAAGYEGKTAKSVEEAERLLH